MTKSEGFITMFSMTPTTRTPSSRNSANSFLTVSRATLEGVVTTMKLIIFTSLMMSRFASPIPGGMSITR